MPGLGCCLRRPTEAPPRASRQRAASAGEGCRLRQPGVRSMQTLLRPARAPLGAIWRRPPRPTTARARRPGRGRRRTCFRRTLAPGEASWPCSMAARQARAPPEASWQRQRHRTNLPQVWRRPMARAMATKRRLVRPSGSTAARSAPLRAAAPSRPAQSKDRDARRQPAAPEEAPPTSAVGRTCEPLLRRLPRCVLARFADEHKDDFALEDIVRGLRRRSIAQAGDRARAQAGRLRQRNEHEHPQSSDGGGGEQNGEEGE